MIKRSTKLLDKKFQLRTTLKILSLKKEGSRGLRSALDACDWTIYLIHKNPQGFLLLGRYIDVNP